MLITNTLQKQTFLIGLVVQNELFSTFVAGEMVEWSITAVLKTAVLKGTGGSNPSLSATERI